jgi:hypothetical protein
MAAGIMCLLVAAWLGAAIFFAAIVAPAAFAVYPSRTLAGALVGRVLPALLWSGLVIGVGVGVATWNMSNRRAGTIGAAVLVLSCSAAQLVVAPRIARLREQIGGSIETLGQADPMRVAFGRLHAQSVAWLFVAMVSAFVVLVLLQRSLIARSAP